MPTFSKYISTNPGEGTDNKYGKNRIKQRSGQATTLSA